VERERRYPSDLTDGQWEIVAPMLPLIKPDTLGLLVVVCDVGGPAGPRRRQDDPAQHLSEYADRFVFADQGFAGRPVDWAAVTLRTTVEIVRKPAEQRGFAVHPKRWVVERSLAWLIAHRRLARDYERDPAVSEAFIRWAAINTTVRRLDRGAPARRRGRRLLNAPE
jgi:transposase